MSSCKHLESKIKKHLHFHSCLGNLRFDDVCRIFLCTINSFIRFDALNWAWISHSLNVSWVGRPTFSINGWRSKKKTLSFIRNRQFDPDFMAIFMCSTVGDLKKYFCYIVLFGKNMSIDLLAWNTWKTPISQ